MGDPESQATEAEGVLADLHRIRRSARQSVLTANWAILVLWGSIFLGSILAFASDVESLSLYWVIAAPIGAMASFALGIREDKGASTGGPLWPYVVTVVGMFLGTFGSLWVLEGTLAVLVWWLALVVGFALIALFDGQRQLLGALVLLVAWGLAAYLLIDDEWALYATLSGTIGGVLLGAGAGLRMVRP